MKRHLRDILQRNRAAFESSSSSASTMRPAGTSSVVVETRDGYDWLIRIKAIQSATEQPS